MPRPTITTMVESIKNACKTDPELKNTFSSRMVNFDETRLQVAFLVRGKGEVVKWIPQSSSIQK
jgi:hypothetical protein